MKPNRSGYTLIEMLITLAIVGAIAALLFPVTTHCGSSPRFNCQSNLKQIGLAMLQYSQDYDERMPPIALAAVSASLSPYARPYGWADALQPYAKSTRIFQCPSEKNAPDLAATEDATQPGFTDYWFNTNLNVVSVRFIDAPTNTLLLGEGNDGRDGSDARYNRNVLPQSWLVPLPPETGLEPRPAQRHLGTGNYLFVDSHVKSFAPQIVVDSDWFAVHKK